MLAGDLNCAKGHQVVVSLQARHVLCDVMQIHNPEASPTRQPGNRTIYFILISPALIQVVVSLHYYPFGYILQSDHRPLLLELDYHKLFTHIPMVPTTQRRLSSKHLKNAKKYRELSSEGLLSANVLKKFKALAQNESKMSRRARRKKLEFLDKQHAHILSRAEASIPLPSPCEWSETPINATILSSYFRKKFFFLGRLSSKPDGATRKLKKELRKRGADPSQRDKTKGPRAQLRRANKSLAQIRAQSTEHRTIFLARKVSGEQDEEKRKSIVSIMRAESDLRTYAAFRRVDTRHSARVSSLTIGEGSEQRTVEDKEKMEMEFQNHIESHFSIPLTNNTPFLTPPLLQHFGHISGTNWARDFMRDPYHTLLDQMHHLAKQILFHLRPTTQSTKTINTHISLPDVIKGYQLWTEKTLTSPMGCQIGHQKT